MKIVIIIMIVMMVMLGLVSIFTLSTPQNNNTTNSPINSNSAPIGSSSKDQSIVCAGMKMNEARQIANLGECSNQGTLSEKFSCNNSTHT